MRRFEWGRFFLIGALLLATSAAGLAYPWLTRSGAIQTAVYQHLEPLSAWSPWLLWSAIALGVLLVLAVLWVGTFGQDGRYPKLHLGTLSPFQNAPRGFRARFRDLPGVLRAVSVALFLVALARPVNQVVPTHSESEGIDAVIVLDLSGSMQAVIDNLPPDLARLSPPEHKSLRPTRLNAAKAVIRDFIARRHTDRIGVVAFGRAAYVVSPPTLDYHLLDQLVSGMELDVIDPNGTAIGDALGVAAARLRRSDAKSKAIILLTDGDNNAGNIEPARAAELAKGVGAKVFPIQLGDGDEAEVLQGTDLFGQPRYRTVRFPVNPALLESIAQKTDGNMYVATDAEALQASFHDVLDKLEKTKFEAATATFEDLYRLFLLPAVLLLALESLLRVWLFRRFP